MAAPPVAPFRVRYGDGAFQLVRLAPGMSEAGIERVVALATGLAVGTFGLRDAEGVSGFHAGLAGDWEAVLLPGHAPPAGAVAAPGEWRERNNPSLRPHRAGQMARGARQRDHARGARGARVFSADALTHIPSPLLSPPFPSSPRRRRRRRRRCPSRAVDRRVLP